MTGRIFRIRKYMLIFLKICTFWENHEFIWKKIWEKDKKISCDFDIFDGSIGCATKDVAAL